MDFSVLTAFLLLAVGLALIIAEVFLPSGGVISFLAALALGGAMFSAWKVWGDTRPQSFWMFLGTTVVLIPSTVGGALWLLSRSRFGNRLFLNPPEPDEVRPRQSDSLRNKLLGQTGEAVTMMVPGGIVRINGERHDAVAEGVMLDTGDPVKVVQVEGNRIVVRAYDPQVEAAKASDVSSASTAESRLNGAAVDSQPVEEVHGANSSTVDSGGHGQPDKSRSGSPQVTSPSEPPLDFDIPGG